MVLSFMRYFVDKDKVMDYVKFVNEEMIPFMLSVPGCKELRAYRDEASGLVIADMEMESYEAWGKAMDDPKMKKMLETLRSFTHDISWGVWGPSPIMPEPLKPTP